MEELHDRFVAICKSGCDGEHPFGSVTTNGTATSYNNQNLQNAIDSIFFSGAHHACDTACSAKLIDFPGTFNTKQYLAPVTLITTKDTCVCDRLVSLGDCWASVGDTSLLEFTISHG